MSTLFVVPVMIMACLKVPVASGDVIEGWQLEQPASFVLDVDTHDVMFREVRTASLLPEEFCPIAEFGKSRARTE